MNAQAIEACGIGDEAKLQEYVAMNPNVLPIAQLKDDAKLLVVAREFGTTSGPIDVLAIDQGGDVYIIETKLYKNPDKRRVVAQMLDYGAALWRGYGDPSVFVSDISRALSVNAKAPSLAVALQRAYETTPETADQIIGTIQQRLRDGEIRFIVLMDQVDDRLRDLVQFINAKSNFDIYAVELEFYRHDGLEIVIPRIYGDEVKKDVAAKSFKSPEYAWDEARFISDVREQLSPPHAEVMLKVLETAKGVAHSESWKDHNFGEMGKLNVIREELQKPLFSLFSNGGIEIKLGSIDKSESAKRFRADFRKTLKVSGFCADADLREDEVFRCDGVEWLRSAETFLSTLNGIK
jgi:hypothetical protein